MQFKVWQQDIIVLMRKICHPPNKRLISSAVPAREVLYLR